ncbi:hypothetical protein Fot_42316 [Forsythia ovata]|uniref:Uncharacterized protein n=1 Tax=Forsythia ovata TaxID=205694 RepID=A0ABD1RPM3_9LAMI
MECCNLLSSWLASKDRESHNKSSPIEHGSSLFFALTYVFSMAIPFLLTWESFFGREEKVHNKTGWSQAEDRGGGEATTDIETPRKTLASAGGVVGPNYLQ